MSGSQRRELNSRLVVLVMHLLKWHYQPSHQGASWKITIRNQRKELRWLLRDSPSLRPLLPDILINAYADARTDAAEETGLALTTFPPDCPWTTEQMLEPDWLP